MMKQTQEEVFTRHFREIQPKFSRFYVRLLTQAHLTFPQYALLNLLITQKIIPMTEASTKLHITKPAVTNLVDRLEKKRLVKRIPHPNDRRITLLQIQKKGEKIVKETQAHVLQFLLKTLHQFNAEERETISRFYASLSKTMDEMLGGRERK